MLKRTSGTFAIFKGRGAAKFIVMYPERGPTRTLKDGSQAEGFITRDGAILLEAAPVVGKRSDGLPEVDWNQKIKFAISVNDISQLLDPKTEKLFHKKDNETKTLQFMPGEGQYAGTMNMYVSRNNDRVHVPLTAGEWAVLQRLLVSTLPTLIGW